MTNRCFHKVIDTLLLLYKSNVKLPASNISISSRILDSFKYSSYFNNYLGALDRTHVEMHVLVDLQRKLGNKLTYGSSCRLYYSISTNK